MYFNKGFVNIVSKKIKKKRKGFTLIEMVIVITIIGILSSIALVKYGKVQETAKLNVDYTNASNIATAASLAISEDSNIKKDISVEKLKQKGYLNTIPNPQSTMGKFEVKVDETDDITVFVNNIKFYPKD